MTVIDEGGHDPSHLSKGRKQGCFLRIGGSAVVKGNDLGALRLGGK